MADYPISAGMRKDVARNYSVSDSELHKKLRLVQDKLAHTNRFDLSEDTDTPERVHDVVQRNGNTYALVLEGHFDSLLGFLSADELAAVKEAHDEIVTLDTSLRSGGAFVSVALRN